MFVIEVSLLRTNPADEATRAQTYISDKTLNAEVDYFARAIYYGAVMDPSPHGRSVPQQVSQVGDD
jgi:hypothetical protein